MTRTLAAALPCGALLLGGIAACDPPTEERVDHRTAVEHGEALFADPRVSPARGNVFSCIDCHAGAPYQPGGSLAGATERPTFWQGQVTTLLGAINHCRYYFMLSDAPWSGEEEEARALWAYLETLGGDGSPVSFTVGDVADPGPGDPTRGAGIYDAACGTCHGAKATGTGKRTPTAPSLPDETLAAHPLGTYTAEERRLVFVEKTRHGTFFGYGGQMPPLSVEALSDADLADVIAYLGVP